MSRLSWDDYFLIELEKVKLEGIIRAVGEEKIRRRKEKRNEV